MKLSDLPFFSSFTSAEQSHLQQVLTIQYKMFTRDEHVVTYGDKLSSLCFLMRGRLAIYHDTIDGETSLISYIEEGDCFAESYALLQLPIPIRVSCLEVSEVMYIQFPTTFAQSQPIVKFYMKLNAMLAQKNIHMNERMHFMTYKKMRGRILAYLYFLANKQATMQVSLPFSRQAFADYLCIDRSALSRELSNMAKDGLISISKQRITLHPH